MQIPFTKLLGLFTKNLNSANFLSAATVGGKIIIKLMLSCTYLQNVPVV